MRKYFYIVQVCIFFLYNDFMSGMNKKAVVAMSGGVDSSVAAKLLLDKGYEVAGITGKMINTPAAQKICENSKRVADKLGIKLHILDVTGDFQKSVVEYFENSYAIGQTPNPCIMCNQFIKWGRLFDYATEILKADVFATGHYADIRFDNGYYKLFPARDAHKDQLYFLYRLGQKQLSKTIFPLSEFDKTEVRQMAFDFDLPPKDSKESQDICFIPKPDTTKKYLLNKFGIKSGDFIEIGTGKKLGSHDGTYLYTIGQRKGVGISAPYPLYVVDIDAEQNIVYLGKDEDNYKSRLALRDINFVYPPEMSEFDAMVKIRYNMQSKKAKCKIVEDLIEIEFYEPVSSVTSGQSGVMYDIHDGHLIGGGIVI